MYQDTLLCALKIFLIIPWRQLLFTEATAAQLCFYFSQHDLRGNKQTVILDSTMHKEQIFTQNRGSRLSTMFLHALSSCLIPSDKQSFLILSQWASPPSFKAAALCCCPCSCTAKLPSLISPHGQTAWNNYLTEKSFINFLVYTNLNGRMFADQYLRSRHAMQTRHFTL